MKTLALMTLLLTSSFSMASGQNYGAIADSPLFSTLYTSAGTSGVSGSFQKAVLELAQEDAVKFVAAQGQGPVSDALRAAIDEVNAKLVAAGIEAKNDNDAAALIVFVNAINSKNNNNL